MKMFTLELFCFVFIVLECCFFRGRKGLPEVPLCCSLHHLFPAHEITLTHVPPLSFEYINKIIYFSFSKTRVSDLTSLACMQHICLK